MNVEEELLRIDKNWSQALENNDVDEIATFMSDDWVIVGSDGITSKSEFLEWIRSGDVSHSRMESDFTQATLYGDTGIVLSRGISAGKYKTQPFELYEWSTSIYLRINNKWLCVHTMLTPANR